MSSKWCSMLCSWGETKRQKLKGYRSKASMFFTKFDYEIAQPGVGLFFWIALKIWMIAVPFVKREHFNAIKSAKIVATCKESPGNRTMQAHVNDSRKFCIRVVLISTTTLTY